MTIRLIGISIGVAIIQLIGCSSVALVDSEAAVCCEKVGDIWESAKDRPALKRKLRNAAKQLGGDSVAPDWATESITFAHAYEKTYFETSVQAAVYICGDRGSLNEPLKNDAENRAF